MMRSASILYCCSLLLAAVLTGCGPQAAAPTPADEPAADEAERVSIGPRHESASKQADTRRDKQTLIGRDSPASHPTEPEKKKWYHFGSGGSKSADSPAAEPKGRTSWFGRPKSADSPAADPKAKTSLFGRSNSEGSPAAEPRGKTSLFGFGRGKTASGDGASKSAAKSAPKKSPSRWPSFRRSTSSNHKSAASKGKPAGANPKARRGLFSLRKKPR